MYYSQVSNTTKSSKETKPLLELSATRNTERQEMVIHVLWKFGPRLTDGILFSLDSVETFLCWSDSFDELSRIEVSDISPRDQTRFERLTFSHPPLPSQTCQKSFSNESIHSREVESPKSERPLRFGQSKVDGKKRGIADLTWWE